MIFANTKRRENFLVCEFQRKNFPLLSPPLIDSSNLPPFGSLPTALSQFTVRIARSDDQLQYLAFRNGNLHSETLKPYTNHPPCELRCYSMEVQSSSSHSHISTCFSAYARKAWRIASIVISLGRPACPAELAEKITFLGLSREFVEFLCWIPNSPLILTDNGLVALSPVALVALGRFLVSWMLRVEVGGWTVPKSLGENVIRTYYKKRKRLGEAVLPSMKKKRSVSRLLGEGKAEDEVLYFNWTMTRKFSQVYGDLCSPINSIVNLPISPAEVTTFHWRSFSEKMLVDPLKHNCRFPTMSVEEKEDEIEQNTPGVDHVSTQENKHLCPDNCMHQVRRVERLKAHSVLVQPPSSSTPRPDSPLLEGNCMKDFMSNKANHALTCTRIDKLYHLNRPESPSARNGFEDYGDFQMEMEMGHAASKRNIKDLSSASYTIEKTAYFRNDIHKESMNDSKNKVVAEVAMRKTNCTPSAYEQPNSQEQHKKSPLKTIKKLQDGLDRRLEGLFKVIEQIDVLPERERLEDPNQSPLKNKTKQRPKNNISNQEKSGSFCLNSSKNVQRKSPAKTMKHLQDLLLQNVEEPSKEQIDDDILKGKCLTGAIAFPIKNKTKQLPSSKLPIQEKNLSFCLSSPKDHIDSKAMPTFDLYTVEDEEGSGGYGTVYRARRKSDEVKFAIKYPHSNANKYHIDNERKLLERFGGKDFVIKYEGSCKSENSDCLVLKHVEHDRPDVLKKDIDISELQWYGYCMFTALRSLHKQGVVHRDVKPGNFLFSRKTCIGYIIDFNLAKALHPKQANTGIYLNPHLKTVSPSKRRKILGNNKAPELAPVGLKKGYKPIESKMLRNKTLESHRNSIASQGADISGLTSVKDLTSTKTPSAERLREPLPCHGRKEFINLAQEAMQIPKQEVAGVPSYKRKRIAAPSATLGRKLDYCTPMPINSSGIALPGSGFLKEGEGKKQKEGSCSGTKGFRAPEVLLRSMHQGPKLDVWSAGVTFLYLMTGKMPFTGEPEQNMKDIVKLRGSEELWELAKLHDCESSFPKELYDVHYLQSMELRNWCKANTKRPEFVKAIPSALFDLVDKCLTVNPRLRISAEEALRHEYFAPCIDIVMRRKRLLKQQVSIKSSK